MPLHPPLQEEDWLGVAAYSPPPYVPTVGTPAVLHDVPAHPELEGVRAKITKFEGVTCGCFSKEQTPMYRVKPDDGRAALSVPASALGHVKPAGHLGLSIECIKVRHTPMTRPLRPSHPLASGQAK